jgi:predicted RNase H-like nuclease (RuvC/YqgF family)
MNTKEKNNMTEYNLNEIAEQVNNPMYQKARKEIRLLKSENTKLKKDRRNNNWGIKVLNEHLNDQNEEISILNERIENAVTMLTDGSNHLDVIRVLKGEADEVCSDSEELTNQD